MLKYNDSKFYKLLGSISICKIYTKNSRNIKSMQTTTDKHVNRQRSDLYLQGDQGEVSWSFLPRDQTLGGQLG